MTEETSKRLRVEYSKEGEVVVIAIRGAFNRRVATTEFQEVASELRLDPFIKKLVIDLVDVSAMDSRGEGELESKLADVLANDGRASVVVDSQRRYLYVALEALIDAFGDSVAVRFSRADAISFVQGGA